MKYALSAGLASMSLLFAPVAFSAPAATLLFTQEGTQILDANGVARPAKRGDFIQLGERLRTPPSAISQILLPDGSLVGMRPGSELKLDLPPTPGEQARQRVSLVSGAVRFITSELMHPGKPSTFTFQSGLATLNLQGADLESAVVRPDGPKVSGAGDSGSYTRMLAGTGSIGNGTLVEPLALRQVSFVGGANVAPIVVASVSPTLFAPPLTLLNLSGISSSRAAAVIDPGAPTPPVVTSRLAPNLTTSTLTAPLDLGAARSMAVATPPPPTAPAPGPAVAAPALGAGVVGTVVTARAPVVTTFAPIVVAPIVIAPVYVPPPTTKLPVITCKVRGLC
jgi:hypothetical protein